MHEPSRTTAASEGGRFRPVAVAGSGWAVIAFAVAACSVPEHATPRVGSTAPALQMPPANRFIGVDLAAGCPVPDPRDQCAPNLCQPPVDPRFSPCPPAPGWTASRLFSYVPPGMMMPIPLPPYLLRYCLYEWNGQGPSDPDQLALVLAGDVDFLAEDRPNVAPQSLADAVHGWQRTRFRSAARGLAGLPQGPMATTQLALLDSSPDSQGDGIPRGYLDHGYVMGWTLVDLTSDQGGPVLAGVRSLLTLPFRDDVTIDLVHGGTFGSRGTIAHQLFAAVESWKPAALSRPRLAILLGLGWAGSAGDPATSSSRAVHDGLIHAACTGAFVAAAAGNDTGGPSPAVGQLYPAAWEAETAPGGAVCASICDSPAIPNYPYTIFPAPPAPLLLSAGGLDYSDRPIAITRPGSLSQLAALALQTAAGDPQQELPLAHTGTSVAATVAAASAAAMWAYDPTLTAPALMSALVASRRAIAAVPQELCVGQACVVQRLSFCDALAAACPRCQLQCLGMPEPRANPAWPDELVEALEIAFPGSGPMASAVSPQQVPWNRHESAAVGPWAHPQPLRPGCDVCGFTTSTGELDIAWSTTYAVDVYDMTLTLNGDSYLIAATVHPGDIVETSIDPVGTTYATLSWTFSDETSGSEEISIVQ